MVCSTCSTPIALRRAWPVAQQCPATSWHEKRVGLVENRGKLRFIHKVESDGLTEGSNPCEGFEADFGPKVPLFAKNCAISGAVHNLRKDSYLLDPKEASQIRQP